MYIEYKTNFTPRNIGQIVAQLEDNLIEKHKYKQESDLWDISKKSSFIESLILGIPIPLFYFIETYNNEKWEILDGVQRLCTLEHFIFGKGKISNKTEKFKLTNLELLKDFEGKGWSDLDKLIKRKILSNTIIISLISKGYHEDDINIILKKIGKNL